MILIMIFENLHSFFVEAGDAFSFVFYSHMILFRFLYCYFLKKNFLLYIVARAPVVYIKGIIKTSVFMFGKLSEELRSGHQCLKHG